MTGTRKSGKGQNAKGAGKKEAARAQPAKSGKRVSAAVGTTRQQEQDRWRELVETSAAWIWETNAAIRHTYTNAFVTRCLGYQPAEFLSLNTLDLVHPDDRGLVKELVRNAVNRKEGWFDRVLRWRHKDGSWRYLESSGSALYDKQGTFIGLCGVDRDITEQKQAAEDLRRSEEKYRDLFENAIDAICIVDRNQNYLDVNRRAIELFGYSREEILSMNVRDMLPPEQHARSEKEFAKLTESGAYEKFTGQVRRKDGSAIDVEVSSSAIVEQGQVIGSRDIIRDVTERRKAEEALRASEIRYRAIVDSQTEFVVRYLPGGILTFVNETLCRYLNMKPEDLLGRSYYPFMHPDDRDEFVRKIEALDRKNSVMIAEARVVLPDGRVAWHRWTHHAIFNERGKPVEYQSTGRDVTEIKETEDRLRESEAKFSKIFKQAPILITLSELDTGRFLDVNEKFLQISGFTQNEVIGRTALEIGWISEGQRARMQQAVRERGRVTGMEISLRRKDGTEVVCLYNGEMITVNGMPRLLSIAQDITERKRVEEELREKESKYRMLFEAANDGIFIQDSTGFRDCNQRGAEMYGLPKEAIIGRPPSEFAPERQPDGRLSAEVAGEKIKAALNGVPQVFEWQPLRANGMPFDVEITLNRLELGGELCLQAIVRDITDRKRAGEKLKESEEKYKFLIETTRTGYVIIGGDGLVVDANAEYVQMSGHDKLDDILGRSVVEWTAAHDQERNAEEVKKCAKAGFVRNLELDYVRKDGRYTPVEINATVMRTGDAIRIFTLCRDITERKRAQEELAGQKAMLQQILDTSSVAIFLVDKTGRIMQANRRMAEMFGRPMDELVGREYVELVHPAERDDGRRKMHALLASEIHKVDLERHYWRKDGTEFWGHLTGRRFYDVHDNELGLIGVISDITERKRAEDALRESEKMLQTIIDAEPECVKLLDENANLIMMNRAGLDMLEVNSLDQVKGQCICPLVTSEYRQEFLDLTRRVFQGGSGTLLFEMVGMKGRHLWLETHAVPLRNEKDEIVALLGVTRDVTERRRAEEALRHSEARFRAMIESASIGILVADVETRKFLYANPEICRLLGYSEQEFHSLSATDLIVPEELTDSIEGFQAHVEGKLNATERTFRRKDGSTVKMSINSVHMEYDSRPGLVGFFTDITEKQLLEQERLKAQKLESIGTLAGGIAHDFNNLLQGIFGYISMAKLTIDQREKALAMLVQAEKALHQSVNLTSQLLTFSKGGKPVKKAVDLRPVIENAVKFSLSGSRVSYDLSFGEDLCGVEADEGQIGQVVQNIVLNAEQSMPLGGRIDIEARNVPATRAAGLPISAPDSLVEIVIRDQGTGIPPEHLPRIFDPYFTTKEKGSGLGLATSYSIVKNHNGMIDVASVLGKGSTITVYLPATRAAKVQAASSASAERTAGRTGSVLVMDDEEIVRVVAGELLQELGHTAEFAEHGDSAIEKYRRAMAEGRPFDVVILDLTIRGGMGGMETLRKLLAIDPGVKAVVSSGYSDDEVIATYRQNGFHGFLKKPYSIGELRTVLDEVMA